jgi:hypothetical protein
MNFRGVPHKSIKVSVEIGEVYKDNIIKEKVEFRNSEIRRLMIRVKVNLIFNINL